ncbi:MAG TPA: YidC/Oxa1 family membrane protein insertase [Candidatus Woesebacteria bacterium]|nr:YidC/Oxa1 family membrane protein insertase [Candidatus Woesebacteria bacterium]
MGELFHTVFVEPILNILVGFYKLFLTLGLPGAFGFSIIAITVLIRIVLHPFFKQQMETASKMQEIKPKLDKLSKKHKDDPKTLQQEQMKAYQQAGINPAAGCVFAIIQIPIFLSLYQTLQLFLKVDSEGLILKQINGDLYFPFLHITSIDPHFFGLNLAHTPNSTGNWLFLSIPVITGILQFLQTRITLPPQPAPAIEKDGEKKESGTAEEFQKAMNTQMKYFFPVMIGYFSYTLPMGLSVYWNIFSIFSILQHFHINKNKKTIELIDATGENVLEPETVEMPKKVKKKKK